MDLEAARERLDRREKTLLQTDDEQSRGRLCPARRAREALLARGAVLVEQARQHELRGVFGQSIDHNAL